MMETVTLIGALLLAVAFGWAALAKALQFTQWHVALASYQLPSQVERVAAWGVPAAEALVVALLAAGPLGAGAAGATALLAGFSLVVVRMRARGSDDKVPCGCFGRAEARDYRVLLVRNASLGGLAALVLVSGDRAGLVQQVRVSGGDAVPMLLVVLAVSLVMWMVAGVATSLRSGGHS